MKNNLFIFPFAFLMIFSASQSFAHEVQNEGYLVDVRGKVVKNNYGECWKTGYWTPAMATEECDPDLFKKVTPPLPAPKKEPVVMAPPPPTPAPSQQPIGPQKQVFKAVNLQAETLFDFDEATLRPEGKQVIDAEIIAPMKQYSSVEIVLVTGHADRIGSDPYNMRLSGKRAEAVKAYMINNGIAASRIETAAMGESSPVVACSDVKGRERSTNKKLVECLQPNRRVVVEVRVQKPVQMF